MHRLQRGAAPTCLARFNHTRDQWSAVTVYQKREIWIELDTKELEDELNICHVFGKPFSPSEVISVLRQAIVEKTPAC